MLILGINCFHADSAACLLRDGAIVAAAEEERFRRIKHWAGFPTEAIQYCLDEAGAAPADLDHVAINRDPGANLLKKALFSVAHRPSLELIRARLENATRVAEPRGAARGDLRRRSRDAQGQVPPRRAPPRAPRRAFLRLAVRARRRGLASTASAISRAPCGGWAPAPGSMCSAGSIFPIRSASSTRRSRSTSASRTTATSTRSWASPPTASPPTWPPMRRIVRLLPDGGFALDLDCFRHHARRHRRWSGTAARPRSAGSSPTPWASCSGPRARAAPRPLDAAPPRHRRARSRRCTRRRSSTS